MSAKEVRRRRTVPMGPRPGRPERDYRMTLRRQRSAGLGNCPYSSYRWSWKCLMWHNALGRRGWKGGPVIHVQLVRSRWMMVATLVHVNP